MEYTLDELLEELNSYSVEAIIDRIEEQRLDRIVEAVLEYDREHQEDERDRADEHYKRIQEGYNG